MREVLAQLGCRDSKHISRGLQHPRLPCLAAVNSAVAALLVEGNLKGNMKQKST